MLVKQTAFGHLQCALDTGQECISLRIDVTVFR